jgi:hypothetical protein
MKGVRMPYEIHKDGGEAVEVVNTQTGRVVDKHEPPDAQGKAERQVRLLHVVENDSEWEKKNA